VTGPGPRSASHSIVARARFLPLAVVVATACGGARGVQAPSARPKPTGAVLLAHPGNATAFAASAVDVVRGRTRWRVDADHGATRARDVLSDAVTGAVPIPADLGGGVALIAEHGIVAAMPSGALRPIVRADLTAVSVGSKELWAREKGSLDWVRIDVAHGRATRVSPPITAPMLTAWSAVGASLGRPVTTGPEFAGPGFALAIVDLLGPVMSRDGGETWTPLDATAVSTAFPTTAPNRIVRDGGSLWLASEDRAVPVSTTGALGAVAPPPKPSSFPEVAAVRVEMTAPFGVRLSGDEILVSDGGRFATVQLDPVRVLRTFRAPDIGRCELVPSTRKGELAAAACVRHDQSAGGQLVIGSVVDQGGAPTLVADKAFSYATAHRLSATAAIVVAATCAGTNEGGIDLLAATKVCVRDEHGAWGDVAISSVTGRRHVVPRADGGVLVVRDDGAGRTELLALPRGATATTEGLRLKLDLKLREIIAVDEITRGRFIVWRRGMTDLAATTFEVTDSVVRKLGEGPRTIIDAAATVGTYGERALIAVSYPTKPGVAPRIEASVTTDGGRTWGTSAWPDGAPPLDLSPMGRRVECGALGCRVFGWSRIGWQPTVISHDRVVTLDDAEPLPSPPAAPSRANTIGARCTSNAPAQNVVASVVPTSPPAYPPQPNDVLLGLPPPKLGTAQTHALTRFNRGSNLRGGLITVGPINGPWGDNARTFVRFSSDLDPLGTVYETHSFASPFPDRMSAQLGYYAPRIIHAAALAPGRILMVICTSGRCDAMRLTAGGAPERLDLGNVVMNDFTNAREMGGSLAILGTGTRRDVATAVKLVEPLPMLAMINAQGTTTSFFAKSDPRTVVTIDSTRGAFGLLSLSAVPTWTDGSAYVLPLGLDARPAGAFEPLIGASPEFTRPTKACGPSGVGWDEADVRQTRMLSLAIDNAAPVSFQAVAGAVRTRMSANGACLDRITAIGRTASFQYDALTQRATYYALDPDGKAGKKQDLTCSIAWE